MASARYDLHGCAGEVFSGFNEEVTYLERVTCGDRAEARRCMENQLGDPASDYRMNPQPIHMRYVVHGDPELAERRTLVPDVPCWLECESDHPDAVPFWKDAP